jgi:ABC-type Fe3+/spermidine/putrescine transport system ATPase subunit
VADVKKNGSDRLLITTRDGLQLASDTREESLDGSLVACIRPEALAIHEEGAQPQTHCKSYIPGRVQDVVYTAGTVRYHVTTDTGARCVVKLTSKRHLPQFDVGQAITLACSSADTLLIQKE